MKNITEMTLEELFAMFANDIIKEQDMLQQIMTGGTRKERLHLAELYIKMYIDKDTDLAPLQTAISLIKSANKE